MPYYRVRAAGLKGMKTIVCTRSILECLESHFYKCSVSPRFPEISFNDESSFPWDTGIDEVLEFYNSWGEARGFLSNCMVTKYAELKADPVSMHKAMFDFWDLDIPEDIIAEALSRTSKAVMTARMNKEDRQTSQRVSQYRLSLKHI